jgi:hypothetical protein
MQFTAELVGIVFAALVGCTRSADLRDQYQKSDRQLPFDRRLRFEAAAPIIVLGHVLAVNEIGHPQRSRGDRRIKVRLTRIKIDIEEVIKGDVRSNLMEFYYFTYSTESDVDLGVPRYLPDVGKHQIYFLKELNGAYRSVGDVTNYTLPVSSGSRDKGFCQGKSPGCGIAELLLVPGRGLDTEWFVARLIQSEYAAKILCSPRVAHDLMQKLSENPDKRISDGAREVIAGTQHQ